MLLIMKIQWDFRTFRFKNNKLLDSLNRMILNINLNDLFIQFKNKKNSQVGYLT